MSESLARSTAEQDAWIRRVLGPVVPAEAPGGRPGPDPRVAAARAAVTVLAGELAALAPWLRALPGGGAVLEREAPLREELAGLGDGAADGEAADGVLARFRTVVEDGRALRDAEQRRRPALIAPLEGGHTDAALLAQASLLAPQLPLLAEAAAMGKDIADATGAVRAARRDPALGLLDPDAALFDEALGRLRVAVEGWDATVVRIERALATEREARARQMAEADAKRLAASGKLGDAIKAMAAVRPAEEKTAARFDATVGSAVPGWSGAAGLAAAVALPLPADLAEAKQADFRAGILACERDSGAAATLAAAAAEWADQFGALRSAGREAQGLGTKFGEGGEAELKAARGAMAVISAAIADSRFDDAKALIAGMKEGIAALQAGDAGRKALGGRDPAAAAQIKASYEAALNQLKAGAFAEAKAAATSLDDRVAGVEGAMGAMAEARRTWPPAKAKAERLKVGPPVLKIDALLKALGPADMPGALLMEPDKLAKAKAFVAAVAGIDRLGIALGQANEAVFKFSNVRSPRAEPLRARITDLLTADPAADPGFARAISALKVLATEADREFERRTALRDERSALNADIEKTLGKDSPYAKALLTRTGAISLDEGDEAGKVLKAARAGMAAAAEGHKALMAAIAGGEKGLKDRNFGLGAIVKLRQTAEQAILADADRGGATAEAAIDALAEAYRFLGDISRRLADVGEKVTKALDLPTADPLRGELRRIWEAARTSATAVDVGPAEAGLAEAERRAALVLACKDVFLQLDCAIRNGSAELRRDVEARRSLALTEAEAWTGPGDGFRKRLDEIAGDLGDQLRIMLANLHASCATATLAAHWKEVAAVFKTVDPPADPPDDPAPALAEIKAAERRNDLPAAIRTLVQDVQGLAAKIEAAHPLLPDLRDYVADWAAVRALYQAEVDRAPPKQVAELKALRKAAEALRFTDPAEGRRVLAPLPAMLATLKRKNDGWKGAVPRPTPARAATFATAGDAEAAAIAELADGGLTPDSIAALVPATTADSFGASAKFPTGFKYEWTTTDGKSVEVYGHGPSSGDSVADDAVSAQGNIVRIKINGKYLQSDGTLTVNMYTDGGHIPLLGNP